MTKRELIRYAAQIAPAVLPYLAGRALNMHRFPGGAGTAGFWHKQLPDHAPDWMPRWDNPAADPGKTTPTWSWTSRPRWSGRPTSARWSGTPGRRGPTTRTSPTYALIDIDPGTGTSWDDVLVLARLHRTALEHLGVRGQPKLTGRRGIQIWIPIAPGPELRGHPRLGRAAVQGRSAPSCPSWSAGNGMSASGAAWPGWTTPRTSSTRPWSRPYSPRAAAGAPVSAPMEWDELDDPGLRPGRRHDPRRAWPGWPRAATCSATVLDRDQTLPEIS